MVNVGKVLFPPCMKLHLNKVVNGNDGDSFSLKFNTYGSLFYLLIGDWRIKDQVYFADNQLFTIKVESLHAFLVNPYGSRYLVSDTGLVRRRVVPDHHAPGVGLARVFHLDRRLPVDRLDGSGVLTRVGLGVADLGGQEGNRQVSTDRRPFGPAPRWKVTKRIFRWRPG